MTTPQLMSVREFRKLATGMAGEWIAENIGSGTYTVRYGNVALCTVNSRKPRRFRSLDGLCQALKEEIGVTRVVVENL